MSDIFALSFFPIGLLASIIISKWRLLFFNNIEVGADLSPLKPTN